MGKTDIIYIKNGEAETAAVWGITRCTLEAAKDRHSKEGKEKALYVGPEHDGNFSVMSVYSDPVMCETSLCQERMSDGLVTSFFGRGRDARGLIADFSEFLELEEITDASENSQFNRTVATYHSITSRLARGAGAAAAKCNKCKDTFSHLRTVFEDNYSAERRMGILRRTGKLGYDSGR